MIMLISMKLAEKINIKIKEAMKSKDSIELESLRAIKSSILLFSTQKGNKSEISESDEIKILSKLVKQRKESADIYKSQNRLDLAQVEIDQAEIIKQFLPEQLNESEIETIVIEIIKKTNASGMQDMGKVMGMVTKELAGKADGKTISQIVRKNLI
tara:strand:+ start:3405 stop:3872 length:468 start_codon:yes stop_codon:yes gene_type:complete